MSESSVDTGAQQVRLVYHNRGDIRYGRTTLGDSGCHHPFFDGGSTFFGRPSTRWPAPSPAKCLQCAPLGCLALPRPIPCRGRDWARLFLTGQRWKYRCQMGSWGLLPARTTDGMGSLANRQHCLPNRTLRSQSGRLRLSNQWLVLAYWKPWSSHLQKMHCPNPSQSLRYHQRNHNCLGPWSYNSRLYWLNHGGFWGTLAKWWDSLDDLASNRLELLCLGEQIQCQHHHRIYRCMSARPGPPIRLCLRYPENSICYFNTQARLPTHRRKSSRLRQGNHLEKRLVLSYHPR